MNNEQIKYIQEDEIDLRELFKTIMKRRIFIIIFTSIITCLAIIWAITRTPIYEAKALIQIGNYNKTLLGNSSILIQKLNILFIDMPKSIKNKKAEIESIKVPKGSKEFISIKSISISNDLAKEEIQKVVKYVQSEHLKILGDVKQRRNIEIKNIESQINNITNKAIPLLSEKIKLLTNALANYKNQIKEISNNLEKIEDTNPSLSALRLMEKRDLTSSFINLSTQLMDMKDEKNTLSTTKINNLNEKKVLILSMMLPHNYKNTQIIGSIITNDYPIKPKKKLIVIVSFVTGLILSIFLVFFLEFIRKDEEDKI